MPVDPIPVDGIQIETRGVWSSGPFTMRCLTCPSVPAVPVIHFKGSPATRQHAFASGHQARYPASYTRRPAEAGLHRLAFLPPFGRRPSLLGHPVPPGNWAPPCGRLTGPPESAPDPDGVSVF